MADDDMQPGDSITYKTSGGDSYPAMVVAVRRDGEVTLIDAVYVISTEYGGAAVTQQSVPIGPDMQNLGDEENPRMAPRNGSWVEPRA